jgi:hypothetical protein
MSGSLLESSSSDSLGNEPSARGKLLIGLGCALLITAFLVAGYAILRRRYTQPALADARAKAAAPGSVTQANGPVRAEIYVDDALLKADQTIIAGTVKNISADNLNGLSVDLELKRRKDGKAERTLAHVVPDQLAPQQSGRYSLEVRSTDYVGVRLVGLKGDATLIAYTSLPGQKRSPEKPESKTIIVSRPPPSKDAFLNTPDNPGRVR